MAASPPRIILLFPDVLQVLAVASESTAAVILEVKRSRFFAHGIAEFMLDCWFTLYYADASVATRLTFPARATECYRWLSQSLWTWSARDAEGCAMRSPSLSFFPLHRWPHKFTHFLQDHPEIDLWPQSFLQTALSVSRSHTPFWPNLLLGFTDDKIVVLCDQYDGYPSKYGLEATFLPLAAVKHVTWIERTIRRQASIAIDVERQGQHIRFAWPTSPQLKHAAQNWIEGTTCRLTLESLQAPAPQEFAMGRASIAIADPAVPKSTSRHQSESK